MAAGATLFVWYLLEDAKRFNTIYTLWFNAPLIATHWDTMESHTHTNLST